MPFWLNHEFGVLLRAGASKSSELFNEPWPSGPRLFLFCVALLEFFNDVQQS